MFRPIYKPQNPTIIAFSFNFGENPRNIGSFGLKLTGRCAKLKAMVC